MDDNSYNLFNSKENPEMSTGSKNLKRFNTDILYSQPINTQFNQNPFQGIIDQDNSILPQKKTRKIAKIPFKVLDAPSLIDDFYLDLIDWSESNVLAVALNHSVYIWDASN